MTAEHNHPDPEYCNPRCPLWDGSTPGKRTTDAGAKRAQKEVVRLCAPGETWRMSIPANPDRDSDLILMGALTDLEGRLLGARLRAESAEAERDALRERLEALIAPKVTVDAISGRASETRVVHIKARDLRAALDGTR